MAHESCFPWISHWRKPEIGESNRKWPEKYQMRYFFPKKTKISKSWTTIIKFLIWFLFSWMLLNRTCLLFQTEGSNRFVPVRLNQNQSVRSQKRRERFNVIIKSYSKFENLEKFRKILPHFLPNCWIFVIWFFWTTGFPMKYYPKKVWKIGPFNLSTKKDRKQVLKADNFVSS